MDKANSKNLATLSDNFWEEEEARRDRGRREEARKENEATARLMFWGGIVFWTLCVTILCLGVRLA